jgi:hypothetical protein
MLLGILLKAGPPEPLVLSITDSTPSGAAEGPASSGVVTSNTTTVSVVSGGIGPYTYAWTQEPGGAADSGPFTPSTPTQASTSWSDTIAALDVDFDETWTCTVTDTGNLNKTQTITALVELIWTNTS